MKKIRIILACIILLLGLWTPQSFAITPTGDISPTTSISPTPNSDTQNLLQQINVLKEKVASKVASLHLVEKRGIIGTITSTTNTLVAINDLQNNTQFIDVDEITKFTSEGGQDIGISDLQKNSMISALGLYNKDSQHLLARFVTIETLPIYISGEIASIDRTNGTFMLATENNKQQNIDVEAFTRTYTLSSSAGFVKVGFSKLSIGDRVIIIGTPNKTNASLTVANRILQFPDVAKNPKITNITTTPSISPPEANVTSQTKQ